MRIFLLCILLSTFSIASSFGAKKLSLQYAVKHKLVSIEARGGFSEEGSAFHNYYGKCIEFKIRNRCSYSIDVNIQAGLILISEYDSIQNMLITGTQLIALAPGQSKTEGIYAMCSEKHDSSPKSSSVFSVGSMVTGHLLQLSQIIDKYGFHTRAGQNAVWVFTDNASPENISSTNPREEEILKQFVYEARGMAYSPFEPTIIDDYSFPEETGSGYSVEGEIEFTTNSVSYVKMELHNNKNQKVKTVHPATKKYAGRYRLEFNIDDYDFIEGEIYWIRVYTDNKLLKEIAVTISQ